MFHYINLTPHPIVLNDGRVYECCGSIARVSSSFTAIEDDVCSTVFGEVTELPEPQKNTRFIVSGMVKAAVPDRADVVAPATGHPDTIRNDKGHIVSVPCFTR